MSNLRWNPYVLFKGEKVFDFWSTYYKDDSKNILYILGKGFDVRMNIGIKKLIEISPNVKVHCLLVEFDEGKGSPSLKYKDLVEQNESELRNVLKGLSISVKKIKLWSTAGKKKKRVGDREAANSIITEACDINAYTDIIVDISSLPRGVYFSLIGKILTLIDNSNEININLFVLAAENAAIDELIKDRTPDEDLGYLYGYSGQLELASEIDKPTVWFPILGEDKEQHIRKAFDHVKQSRSSLLEICPILPFPSTVPRRSDQLIINYHSLLFDELAIEPQNLLYVPEQNPFEAYRSIVNAIRNYNDSLRPLNGCKAVVSTFSSKLLSIGALLVSYELKGQEEVGVGVLNVDSKGYEIDDVEQVKKLKDDSELFVTWLAGSPYS